MIGWTRDTQPRSRTEWYTDPGAHVDGSGARSIRPDADGPVGLTPLREQQLLARHRAGDAGALTELLRAYQSRVYAICYRMVPREDVLDLTQDALIRVMEGLDSYDGRSSLSTWIIRVTMNCCLSHLRKQRIRRHASLDAAADHGPDELLPLGREPSPLDRVQQDEARGLLLEALGRLDPRLRAILVLRDLQGLDYQQVAAVLGAPVGTVKSRLFRARAALRRTAEELTGEQAAGGHEEGTVQGKP
jgi:RNA polymerase sigma-70 factor (ECF subfamily)